MCKINEALYRECIRQLVDAFAHLMHDRSRGDICQLLLVLLMRFSGP
jgi:hypothetical protein